MVKFSVVILTRNEEENILDCLETLLSIDEVIIVDDNSQDRTLEIIKNQKTRKIKIYLRSLNLDFSKQRNFALSKAKNDWVLFLDADERLSEDLVREIKSKIKKSNFEGFFIKRRDVLWGRKLTYGETGNIKLLRLARKNVGKWTGKVHEVWNVGGNIGELDNELIHFPHQKIREFLSEISLYSSIRAEELHQEKVRASALDVILYPKAKFFLNYFLRLGFFDGLPGLIVALMMSFHSFLVRAKLWLLQNEK